MTQKKKRRTDDIKISRSLQRRRKKGVSQTHPFSFFNGQPTMPPSLTECLPLSVQVPGRNSTSRLFFGRSLVRNDDPPRDSTRL